MIASELPNIKSAVIGCTAIGKPEAITVEPYTDVILPPRDPQLASAGSGITLMLGGHIKEIALGGLALASLFMMSMMVRGARSLRWCCRHRPFAPRLPARCRPTKP